MTPEQFWKTRMSQVQPYWWDEASDIFASAEPRRAKAKFNTGSISLIAAVAIRAICAWVQPVKVIEVGTFIGVSTMSLARCAGHVYTCDISNDCLEATEKVSTFPYCRATEMFKTLKAETVTADLFFFDGLLSGEDIGLVKALSEPNAVYLFDDYNESFKGVANVSAMQPTLAGYVLMPAAGQVKKHTTLAALVPEARL